MDNTTTIQELKEKIKKFCEEREWDKFHNAKDLSIGIITEAAELLEIFRWKSNKEVEELFKTRRGDIEDELSDVLYFVLRLAQKYGIDLSDSLARKLAKNEKKYPIKKSKGSNKKYTEL
ncbi:MAG: nucleotide pyrophosphohydrolase [Candidatus Heimdallarchaeaceae archaeon]